MTRHISLWAALVVIAAAPATPADAQPASDEWQVLVSPYLMGAGMSGYRWLDLDYASGEGAGEFGYDVLTQGPVLGFGFRF